MKGARGWAQGNWEVSRKDIVDDLGAWKWRKCLDLKDILKSKAGIIDGLVVEIKRIN